MMRSLSPNTRQIMAEKVEGARYLNVKTWRDVLHKPNKHVANVLSPYSTRQKLSAITRSETFYSKAIDDSARMPPDTLDNVVQSVNFLSKQLRSDLKVTDDDDDPLLQY